MQFGGIPAPADVTIELPNVGGVGLPPTIGVQTIGGDVSRGVAAPDAILERAADGPERPGMRLGRRTVPGETILHLDRQRPAERIEAEDGVGTLEIHFVDGDIGQQVPVHRVAERLVEPHPVQIDGQSLRIAIERGRGKPAIDQVRLKLIALRVVQRHTRHRVLQRPQG